MSDFAIRARKVSKKFRQQPMRRTSLKERFVKGKGGEVEEFWSLRDISFELKRGESLGILGRNGAGKSTALKVIGGIYRPTSGELHVTGRVSTLLDLGAGFHPELTGRENIYLSSALLGLKRKHVQDSVDRIVEFTNLETFIDTPVKMYSSGMQLRLGYAIAMEIEPEILVIDEIIAVGDEAFQRQCYAHMDELRASGTTMVVVSHSMKTLEDLCDQTLWLEGGRMRQLGPTPDVVAEYMESTRLELQESASPPYEGASPGSLAPNPIE